jgi:hypothetical protein
MWLFPFAYGQPEGGDALYANNFKWREVSKDIPTTRKPMNFIYSNVITFVFQKIFSVKMKSKEGVDVTL